MGTSRTGQEAILAMPQLPCMTDEVLKREGICLGSPVKALVEADLEPCSPHPRTLTSIVWNGEILGRALCENTRADLVSNTDSVCI